MSLERSENRTTLGNAPTTVHVEYTIALFILTVLVDGKRVTAGFSVIMPKKNSWNLTIWIGFALVLLCLSFPAHAEVDEEVTTTNDQPTARLESRQGFLGSLRQNEWKKVNIKPDPEYYIDPKLVRHQHVKNYGDKLDIPNKEIGHLEISIKAQQVYIFDTYGNKIITSETVTGRPGWNTPKGTHTIKLKRKSWVMKGDVVRYGKREQWSVFTNYASYFTYQGHALHDIKRKRFGVGTTGSHGCANLPLEVSRYIYNNAPIGTEVNIY